MMKTTEIDCLKALEAASPKWVLGSYRPNVGRGGSFRGSREESGPCHFQLLIAAAFLGLRHHHSSFCFCHHLSCPPLCSNFPPLSLIKTLWWQLGPIGIIQDDLHPYSKHTSKVFLPNRAMSTDPRDWAWIPSGTVIQSVPSLWASCFSVPSQLGCLILQALLSHALLLGLQIALTVNSAAAWTILSLKVCVLLRRGESGRIWPNELWILGFEGNIKEQGMAAADATWQLRNASDDKISIYRGEC